MKSARFLPLVVGVLLCACDADSTAPNPQITDTKPRVLAAVEFTFYNIGEPNMTSTALVASSVAELEWKRAARARGEIAGTDGTADLTVPAGGNATIQVRFVSTQFLVEKDENDTTYIKFVANYDVRNATLGPETPFTTPRNNLTFLAVSSVNTINQTPVLRIQNAAGVNIPQRAIDVRPRATGDHSWNPQIPDMVQVFLESEVPLATIKAMDPSITNTFPYGFMVRAVTATGALVTTNRTLPANPTATEFRGRLTIGLDLPDHVDNTQDPKVISILMLALDDSHTKLTQALDEQHGSEMSDAEDRAIALGALLTVLPWGDRHGNDFPTKVPAGGIRLICQVRTAGFAGAATAFYINKRVPTNAGGQTLQCSDPPQ